MTDRHMGYVVTLTEDIREDDAERIVLALQMVKGVLSVRPLVKDYTSHIVSERRDTAWREALLVLVREGPVGG